MMNLGNLRRTFVLVGFSMLLCEDCCLRIYFGFVIVQFSKNARESGKMHSDATCKNVKKQDCIHSVSKREAIQDKGLNIALCTLS